MFVFIVKQDIKKWYADFYAEFENEQKKDKIFLTFRSGDSNPRFSVIFTEGEGDEIKSKQASKRHRTLLYFQAPSFSAYGLFFKNDEGRLLKRGFTYENSNLMWKLICSYIYLYNVVNLL